MASWGPVASGKDGVGRYLINKMEDTPLKDEHSFLATVKEDYLQKR